MIDSCNAEVKETSQTQEKSGEWHDTFDDDAAEWQMEMMEAEMNAQQADIWEGHPQEIEELLSQVEAEAHA